MNETLDPTIKNLASAIKKQESGGNKDPYNAKGASGEHGAYQFMPNTWKAWAGTHLGDANAPMTMENQNKVAYNQIKSWKDKGYNPAQIAAAWNAGEGSLKEDKWKTNVGTNSLGVKYDTPSYVKNVSKYYQERKGSTPTQAPEDLQNILSGNYQAPEAPTGMAGTGETNPGGILKNIANGATEAPMVLGGGVLNLATQAVGGTPQPTYSNPLGEQQNALGYRDGEKLSGYETAKQGTGAVMEGLSYAMGGPELKGALEFGKAGALPYVKESAKAGGKMLGLASAGSSLQEDGSIPTAIGHGVAGYAGGYLLGGLTGAAAAKYNKSAGYSPEIFNNLDDAVKAGDTAKVAEISASPEYKRFISANKYDSKAVNNSVKEIRKSIDEGIDNSYGVSKMTRTEKAETLTDDGITAMLEHAKNTKNPIGDTKLALENKANDLMDEALNPVIDKIRNEKLPLVPLSRQGLLDDFNKQLDKSYITDLDKQKIRDYVETLINTQNKGGEFGIVDAGIIRREANFDFTNPKNKGAVSRILGNTMRDALGNAEKTATDPATKAIIAHINAVNKEYSRLMQGIDVIDLMARFPGQKSSELLNKAAGFFGAGASGNNPLAYLGAHRLTNTAQNMMIRSKTGKLFGDLSSKSGPISSSELIGNANRILNNVSGVAEKQAATNAAMMASREAAQQKNSAVNKLMETLSPKRDKDLPVIEMGPKPVSKYTLADSKLPVAKGAPKVYGDISAETKSYMDLYEKNGVQIEKLSSKAFDGKDRQKIINFLNKQPDAVVVAEREKLANLIAGQKAVVERFKESDAPFIIKKLNKLTDKRGEFKGQLNLNNAKGQRTKGNETYLRETFGNNDNVYSAEDLASEFYDLKESYKNAKDLLVDLNKEFKRLGSGSLPGFAGQKELGVAAALSPLGILGANKMSSMGKETYQREPDTETKAQQEPETTPETQKVEQLASQIARAETRGEKDPYSVAKWSDRTLGPASPLGKDLGKYQITSARLREKSKAFLGRVVSDIEFLASPELQDRFIKAQVEWQLKHGLTPEQVLATHRRGWGNMKPEQLKKAVDNSKQYIEMAMNGK